MKNKIEETIIVGDSAYGVTKGHKPTFLTRLKAKFWLKWWAIRIWLGEHGLFVKKIVWDGEYVAEVTPTHPKSLQAPTGYTSIICKNCGKKFKHYEPIMCIDCQLEE